MGVAGKVIKAEVLLRVAKATAVAIGLAAAAKGLHMVSRKRRRTASR